MKNKNIQILCLGVIVLSCTIHSDKKTVEQSTKNNVNLCVGLASMKGIDNLPSPKLMEGIGNSHLIITTKSPEAQIWFDQGLNQLHGFWHLEAYRSFRELLKHDSTCAMGYWGIAMCAPGFGGNENIWQQAINVAIKSCSKVSPFEQDLITATSILLKDGITEAQTPFRNLYKKYPNEPEGIAFASIILRQHQNKDTQQEVIQLLENSLKINPTHLGLMHYYVHLMELDHDFAKAIPVAEKMIRITRNSPHISHMSGHLYYLSGDYQKAVDIFSRTRAKELVYHKAENIPLASNQNYIHNLQFLTVALSELNNYQAAFKMAKELSYLTLSSEMPNLGAMQMLLYEGRILPALVAIRYLKWQDAEAELNFWLYTHDSSIPYKMVQIYLRSMLAYVQAMSILTKIPNENSKQVAIAKGDELTRLMQQFEQEAQTYQNMPEFKSINETFDILSMARYELAGWIDNIDKKQAFNDLAWKEAIKLQNLINYDEPPRLIYPIEESLARLRNYRGERAEALKAIKAALIRRPKSKKILAIKNKI